MMNRKLAMSALIFGLSALSLFTMAGDAFAAPWNNHHNGHHYGWRVNNRQCNQDRRIFQGYRRGQLTGREARNLWQNERGVRRYEAMARSDGRISPREYRVLDRLQDRQNRAIYNQRHDGQARW